MRHFNLLRRKRLWIPSANTIFFVGLCILLLGAYFFLTAGSHHVSEKRKERTAAPTSEPVEVTEEPQPPETPPPVAVTCEVTEDVDYDLLHFMKENAGASEGSYCLEALEALDPSMPFVDVENSCQENKRRWFTLEEHLQHIDMVTVMQRKRRAVQLMRTCPPHKNSFLQYFDFGCRWFESSVKWFLDHYHNGQLFQIHAFDRHPKYANDSKFFSEPNVGFQQALPWNDTGFVTFLLDRPLPLEGTEPNPLHEFMNDRPSPFVFHYSLHGVNPKSFFPAGVSPRRLLTVESFSVAHYLMREVKAQDFVVVKIDGLGYERMLVDHMIRSGVMHLVDELFIVCHNAEMDPLWNVDIFPKDCQEWISTLRKGGVYVHEWYL